MLHGLLIAENDPEDFRFLAESLAEGLERDLDRELAEPRPDVSILWSMLWEGARLGRFGASCPKTVRFRLAGREFSMELDLAESPECGYLRRNPAPHITRLILRGGRTMIDVGANVGFHALCARSTVDRVHAFEPVPPTAARLRRNVELSEAAETVLVHEVALSSSSGRAGMSVEPGHCGANRLVDGGDSSGVDVATEPLDELAGRVGIEGVDLVKIDVEGHESEVARGGGDLFDRDRPRIVVELGDRQRFRAFRNSIPTAYRAFVPEADGSMRPVDRWEETGGFRDLIFADPDHRDPRTGAILRPIH
jgi:FkbM family methyltransferase